ncbi:MAG: class I SAM-dependent methyltransferase, partial [Proteobacteria bacterium]|nr:class I SAM-dependent methyltransferase [Pseudomonadota bacterium]
MKLIPDALIEKRFFQSLEKLQHGSLTFTTPDGRSQYFKGPHPGPHGQWTIHDWAVIKNAMSRGDIALGEDYIAGLWDTDDIEALFAMLMLNMDELDDYAHGDF